MDFSIYITCRPLFKPYDEKSALLPYRAKIEEIVQQKNPFHFVDLVVDIYNSLALEVFNLRKIEHKE